VIAAMKLINEKAEKIISKIVPIFAETPAISYRPKR
jgi:hypothetical protein